MRKKGAALRAVQRPLTAFRQAQDDRALGVEWPNQSVRARLAPCQRAHCEHRSRPCPHPVRGRLRAVRAVTFVTFHSVPRWRPAARSAGSRSPKHLIIANIGNIRRRTDGGSPSTNVGRKSSVAGRGEDGAKRLRARRQVA
jgi:hypothetical protein